MESDSLVNAAYQQIAHGLHETYKTSIPDVNGRNKIFSS